MSVGSPDAIAFTRSNSPALIASINAAVSALVSAIDRLYSAILLVCLLACAASADAQPPERPPLGTTITIAALGNLPAAGNLFSLLDTAVPDLIADRIDTGGLSAGDPARVGAHGSTWTQTLFTVGDVDITDPGGSGTPLLVPGVDAWQRVDVATGLMPIDRNAPGLAITLVPRAPATVWSRAFSGMAS